MVTCILELGYVVNAGGETHACHPFVHVWTLQHKMHDGLPTGTAQWPNLQPTDAMPLA